MARIVDRHTVLPALSTELRREFRRLKLGLLTFAQPFRPRFSVQEASRFTAPNRDWEDDFRAEG